MSLQEVFLNQKKGTAQLIAEVFGQNLPELATTLDRELGEQVRFDHREIAVAELDGIWNALPSIGSLVGSGSRSDLDALKNSSYAFRLMTLAQASRRLQAQGKSAFAGILDEFGLGELEVESYANDFVR